MSWMAAGAVNDTVRALRDNRRFSEAMKARGAARREYRRELARRGLRDPDSERTVAPFPCFELCMDCGRLLDPRSPMAEARRANSAPRTCPACHGNCVVDLRDDETANQLETFDRGGAPGRDGTLLRWTKRAATIGAAVGLPVALASAFVVALEERVPQEAFVVTMLVVGILFTANVWLVRFASETWQRTRAPQTPARWSMIPLRSRARSTPIAAGDASADDHLVAPLSGRTCVAWEIGIRDDDDADAPVGSWTLLEQRCAPTLRVASWRAEDAPPHLQLTRTPLHTADLDTERARIFFRARGLPYPCAGAIYETVLRAGQLASVHETTDRDAPTTVVRSRSR